MNGVSIATQLCLFSRVIECNTPFLCQDVKQRGQKKKRVKKNKKKEKSLIEESILRVSFRSSFSPINSELILRNSGQMQTSTSHTGPSRARRQNIKAEGVTGYVSHCRTPSAFKHPEEPRQGEEGPLAPTKVPLLQQDAKHWSLSVMGETHSTDPPPERPTKLFTSILDPSATEGHADYPGHHGLRDGCPTSPGLTTPSGSPEQSAPIGGPEPKSGPKGSVSNESKVAAGGEGSYDSVQHNKHAPSLERSDEGILPTDAQWDQDNHNQVHWSGYAAVDRQIAETLSDGERVPMVDLVDGPKHGRTSEKNSFDIESNNGFDMDADFSVPMVEDQVELQFGTTFHPHYYDCQPSSYNEGSSEQRNDIVLEDSIPGCAEDSAMEDAEPETQDVADMATVTGMVQFPSAPLFVPSSEYVSPSGASPWPCGETPADAFVDSLTPIFEPAMLRELHTPNSVALQGLVFPQVALLPDNAPVFVSNPVESSTSVAEINSLEYRAPVGFLESPITALGASTSQTASCSSPSPLFPSPPRAISTPVSKPASPPIFTHIQGHQREIERVDSTFNPAQGISIDVGIQRDMGCV